MSVAVDAMLLYILNIHVDQLPSFPTTYTQQRKPGQVVYTHVPLSPGSIIWYQAVGGDARRLGGNRWPGGK